MPLYLVPKMIGPHLFCGPTAMCAVTGLNPVTVLGMAHRVMKRRYDRPIVSMSDHELVCTLAALGFRTVQWIPERRITLRRYGTHNPKKGYAQIARTATHYVAYANGELLDNNTGGMPVHPDMIGNPISVVKHFWTVQQL